MENTMPRHRSTSHRACALLALALALLHPASEASELQAVRLDELPMYGGPAAFQTSRDQDPALKAADDKLVLDAGARFGSREQAARAFIQSAHGYYGQNQPGMAMRRFNQAWLLNPDNPDVYAGYAAVLNDQGKMCDAMRMMEKVESMPGPDRPGFLPDTARVTALCAVGDASLAPDARAALYARADELYRQAETSERDKGYVYYSWATADYWRGDYEGAWRMVARARSNGAAPNAKFLGMLAAKMPEPDEKKPPR
jgi:tetratricopeptide (TPR) repeat protein